MTDRNLEVGAEPIIIEGTSLQQERFERRLRDYGWDTYTREEISKARTVIRNEMVKKHHKTPLENPKQ